MEKLLPEPSNHYSKLILHSELSKRSQPSIEVRTEEEKEENDKVHDDVDYEVWQKQLLKLCVKLSDIESTRTHAIYNCNTGNHYNFVNFQ